MNSTKSKTLKESILRFFSYALCVFCCVFALVGCNKTKGSGEGGVYNFKLIDENSEVVINDDIKFEPNENLYDSLNRVYELEVREDFGYTAIISITSNNKTYSTSWNSSYFEISVVGNDGYWLYGAKDTYLEDGMEIVFTWKSLSDF